jgi:hypothetical protein
LKAIRALSLCALTLLSGCGTYVPDLQNFYESRDPNAEKLKVQSLIEHVACEVKTAVQQVLIIDQDNVARSASVGYKESTQLDWLKTWVAQLTFTLTVDEKSQVNPGAAINQVLPNAAATFAHHPAVSTGQMFSVGLAAAYSADATRKETPTLYIPLAPSTDDKSLAEARKSIADGTFSCKTPDFDTNFKFMDWLEDVTFGAYVHGGVTGNYSNDLVSAAAAKSGGALSHQVTFIIMYSGGVTPTWKLINFTGSTTSPLFGAQRSNTQDVIITLGPPASPPSGGGKGAPKSAPLALGTAAENTTLAALIGISVANQINITQINILP